MKFFLLCAAVLIALMIAFCGFAADSAAPSPRVLLMEIDGSINPGTADFIARGIERAKAGQFEALVIEMDTPGGLLDSTRDIVKSMLNADVPVVVYVGPRGARAGSAGVFITLASHVAAMAPGTNIGAAHPVTGFGKDPESEGGKHLAQKIENDTSAFIETIAKERKRNITWARQAVVDSVSITEQRAAELKVIDFVAADRQDLLRRLDGVHVELPARQVTLNTKTAQIEAFDMSWKQSFVNLFSNPNIVYFLIVIALLGIYLELSHPGAILPGVAAGLAMVLILVSSKSLPFSAGGVLLLLLGAVFFVLEVYVTSYGMLAVGGIVAFFMGSLLLFDPDKDWGSLAISRGLIEVTTTVVTALVGVTLYFITKAQRRRVSTGYEGLIGEEGMVTEALSPEGQVKVQGEFWQAVADQPLTVGTRVRVTQAQGLKIKVESLERK